MERGTHSIAENTGQEGICVRAASTHGRRAAVRHEVLVDEIPEAEPATNFGGDVERFHASEQLMPLLATLDEDKRAVPIRPR